MRKYFLIELEGEEEDFPSEDFPSLRTLSRWVDDGLVQSNRIESIDLPDESGLTALDIEKVFC